MKKIGVTKKRNYRLVSTLPNLSQRSENILSKIYKIIAPHFEKIPSKYQTGFRKVFNPQTYVLAIIDKFRKSLNQRGEYVALLTDLSKAFDCLPHDLIIAKLHACGFGMPSLRLMHS